MNVFVLLPFFARLSTVTVESNNVAKGIPQPVSGNAFTSLLAAVESPAIKILIFFLGGKENANRRIVKYRKNFDLII